MTKTLRMKRLEPVKEKIELHSYECPKDESCTAENASNPCMTMRFFRQLSMIKVQEPIEDNQR